MKESKTDIQKKNSTETPAPSNFIRQIIKADIEAGKNDGRVHTRFPPEPNGYLHIGHAKSICLNFGLAANFKGLCNLRFDDTDPSKEEVEYVDSIKKDVRWLGFDWEEREFYASDYFEQLFEYALQLIKAGKAYVDSLNAEEIREYRGTLTEPGKKQSLSGPIHRRKSGSVRTDAGRGIRGRRSRAARQNRYGFAQYAHAGSHPLPYQESAPLSLGKNVGNIPHV